MHSKVGAEVNGGMMVPCTKLVAKFCILTSDSVETKTSNTDIFELYTSNLESYVSNIDEATYQESKLEKERAGAGNSQTATTYTPSSLT